MQIECRNSSQMEILEQQFLQLQGEQEKKEEERIVEGKLPTMGTITEDDLESQCATTTEKCTERRSDLGTSVLINNSQISKALEGRSDKAISQFGRNQFDPSSSSHYDGSTSQLYPRNLNMEDGTQDSDKKSAISNMKLGVGGYPMLSDMIGSSVDTRVEDNTTHQLKTMMSDDPPQEVYEREDIDRMV